MNEITFKFTDEQIERITGHFVAVAQAASRFAEAFAEGIAPAFQRLSLEWRRINYCRGYEHAMLGLPRDWSETDDWHRGYLAGKLRFRKRA